ncbi:MAG: hypothetical protein UY81_C0060G0006 [Candidatus Giovannonibacteria bacterium GW2011_GWA2_53_7]|uniref:Pilus assembly protein, PilO n=1 Tax=Candidatus Giovannonibacteria bacterium GW2011_GWA2_53_7 TaxID=1618650 RepID=A0A0G2A204_9BACT|nr:MAG: hypothetical protein UY81_C0060G0006 [Candidatus Giovannonibacteria bacterium GW2011_GWA2_53_7]
MAGAIGLFIVTPQYDEVRTLQLTEDALLQDLEDVKTINEKVDALRTQHAELPRGAEAKLDVLLPERVDGVRFLIDVDAVVLKNGLQMRNPAVSANAAAKNATGVSRLSKNMLRFEIVGTYAELQGLLVDIERSLALRDVSSLSFTSGEVVGAMPRYNKSGEIIRSYFIEIGTYSFR